MIDLTVYANAHSPDPAARPTLSWDDFCTEVEALCREDHGVTDKRDLVAFGPYRLRDGTKRAASNVESMSRVIGIDVDGCDVEALRVRLRTLGLAAIVHGSPSDDPKGPRKVRVYILADRVHAAQDGGHVRDAVAALLGVQYDRSTRNADRIFFCGRLTGTPERYVERFEGVPLALDTLPAAPVSNAATDRDSAPDRQGDPAYDAASYAILGALGSWENYEGRKHDVCGALGGALRKSPGWSRADCEALIRAWLRDAPPSVNVDHGVNWACGAFDKPADEVSGRAGLERALGAKVAGVIGEALLLPFRSRQLQSDAEVDVPRALDNLVEDPDAPRSPIVYLCRGLGLAPIAGKVTVIYGQPGAGKGPLADYMATRIAFGDPILGHVCTQTGVAILDFEGSGLTLDRCDRLARAMKHARCDLRDRVTTINASEIDRAHTEAFVGEVAEFTARRGIGAVIVDSYTSAMMASGLDPNRPEYAILLRYLGRLSARGILVIAIMHATKAAAGHAEPALVDIANSGALASTASTAISVMHPGGDKNVIRIGCARAPHGPFDSFDARWTDGDDGSLDLVKVDKPPRKPSANEQRAIDKAAGIMQAGQMIMRDFPERQATAKEISALAVGTRGEVKEAIERLRQAGLIAAAPGNYLVRTPLGAVSTPVQIALALQRR